MTRRTTLAGWLMLMLLGAAGCGLLLGDSVACDSDQFYGYRATLPANAEDIHETCSNDFNPTYEASFSLPVRDLSQFRSSTSITKWQTSAPDGTVFSRQAGQARSVLYGTSSNGAIFEQVLIDLSDAQRAKIYMQIVNVD